MTIVFKNIDKAKLIFQQKNDLIQTCKYLKCFIIIIHFTKIPTLHEKKISTR